MYSNNQPTTTQSQSPKFQVSISELGELKITSTDEVSQENLQALLDHTKLQANAHLKYQSERDKEQSLYVVVAAIFICLGLFTVSYSLVRAIGSTFKTSEVTQYARQTFS